MDLDRIRTNLQFTPGRTGLVGGLAILYLISLLTRQQLGATVFGYGLGSLLIYMSSEGIIKGLENFAFHAGLSKYAAGVVSGFASGIPETLVVVLLISTGIAALVETAVISVVLTAGFNLLLVAVYILLAGSKTKGVIPVPTQVIERESELLRISIVSAAIIFALGLTRGVGSSLPWELGAFMLVAYLVYATFIFRKRDSDKETPGPTMPRAESYVLLIVGFLMIVLAAETLRSSTELVVEFFHLGTVPAATLVALAGTVPEHGIAIAGGLKGEHSIGLANLLAGVTQTFLITFGAIVLLATVVVNGFLLFQLATFAGAVWLVKKSITDDQRLTVDEGVFILALQILIFILIEELTF